MDSEKEASLLPCPFCGGQAELCFQRDDLGDWKVECQGCGAVSCPEGMRYDKKLAIMDWNKRILKTMKKKPKSQKVPRTRAGGEMTEAQFWRFLRANLRLASSKWAPRRLVLKACRRPSESDNKRLKFEHQCAECKNWFPQKQIEVDHIVPVGRLLAFDDLPGFVERLFCEPDGLVVLCEQCHHAKTYSSLEK